MKFWNESLEIFMIFSFLKLENLIVKKKKTPIWHDIEKCNIYGENLTFVKKLLTLREI